MSVLSLGANKEVSNVEATGPTIHKLKDCQFISLHLQSGSIAHNLFTLLHHV